MARSSRKDRRPRSRATRASRPCISGRRALPDFLRVQGLRAGYAEAIVIDDIGFTLGEGKSLALLGRNGTGKTTLLCTLVGVTRHRAGRIDLGGTDLTRLRPDQRAAAGVGWVPQERNI